jgi:hypothetical protein
LSKYVLVVAKNRSQQLSKYALVVVKNRRSKVEEVCPIKCKGLGVIVVEVRPSSCKVLRANICINMCQYSSVKDWGSITTAKTYFYNYNYSRRSMA